MFDVFGFYKFIKISYLKKNQKILHDQLLNKNIRGTIIISNEGLNGTISGKNKDIKLIKDYLHKLFKFEKFDSINNSKSSFQPFHKPKVKIKKEVVPMNLSLKKRIKKKDSHVNPQKWNSLIKDIAMFCTGGIRCEKASVFLENKGYNNVYQLKGGILNYLKKTDPKKSLWKGECFVFDNRISLKHGLKIGSYSMCSGCRKPISPKDKKSKKYEEGVSCPNCHDNLTNDQKSRFRMRQKQINLAKKTGKSHIFQKEY